MSQENRNPARGGAGSRKAVLAPTLNTSEDNVSLIDRQARFISKRFCVPPVLAATIAALAFHNGGRI
jgi:hypothetical protein